MNLCCSLKTGHIIISELSFKTYHFIYFETFLSITGLSSTKTWVRVRYTYLMCPVISFLSSEFETSERLFECVRKGTLTLFCGFRWFVCRSVVCRSSVWTCGIKRADQRMLHFSHFILSLWRTLNSRSSRNQEDVSVIKSDISDLKKEKKRRNLGFREDAFIKI